MEKKKTEVFIQDPGGNRSPFWIEPYCRLARMKQVLSEALRMTIHTLRHERHDKLLRDLVAADEQKYLVEDYDLQRHDIIVVGGGGGR
jgi:hypothetical protein